MKASFCRCFVLKIWTDGMPQPGADWSRNNTFASQGQSQNTADAQGQGEASQGRSRATPDSSNETIQEEIIVRLPEEQESPAEERSQLGRRSSARPPSLEPSTQRRSVRIRDKRRQRPWNFNSMAVEYRLEEILLQETDQLDALLGTFLNG